MAARIDPTAADLERRLRLLDLLKEVMSTDAELARVVGVGRSTVTQWLNGDRSPPEWHVLLATVELVLDRRPSATARVVEFFAESAFGLRGRWIPESGGPGKTFAEESADVVVALGGLTQAVRTQDGQAEDRARDFLREAHEVAAVIRGAA